jgi:RNA polymerase sigma-70 factor, ECF subfamily
VKQQQRRAFVPLPEENDAADGHAMIATDANPESETIISDQKQVLERLLASLPEEHRSVLMLREIEEMDYAQIAAVTNVPIGTVMSRLARSRAALKSKWLQQVEGEPRAVR